MYFFSWDFQILDTLDMYVRCTHLWYIGHVVFLCPREVPQSSPASPLKTPSFPPLLLRLTQDHHMAIGVNVGKGHQENCWALLLWSVDTLGPFTKYLACVLTYHFLFAHFQLKGNVRQAAWWWITEIVGGLPKLMKWVLINWINTHWVLINWINTHFISFRSPPTISVTLVFFVHQCEYSLPTIPFWKRTSKKCLCHHCCHSTGENYVLKTQELEAKEGSFTWNSQKRTQGFVCCLFKAALLETLNNQMLSSLDTYDALSLVDHKAQLHLVWLHIVDIFSALVNSW